MFSYGLGPKEAFIPHKLISVQIALWLGKTQWWLEMCSYVASHVSSPHLNCMTGQGSR